MPNTRTTALLKAMEEMAAFATRIGANKHADGFAKLCDRLKQDNAKVKEIGEQAFSLRGMLAFSVVKAERNLSEAQKKELSSEHKALREALDNALFPPKASKWKETDVSGLAGLKEPTRVLGEPDYAEAIAQGAVHVVEAFSQAVFHRDYAAAHACCASPFRKWASAKRLEKDLRAADERYGGPATALKVERINSIWADAAARNQSNNVGQWPPKTPKESKRAVVGTFWFTNPLENKGRWAAFWIVEEEGSYRIVKWQQYLQ